jgi:hypothetical protein
MTTNRLESVVRRTISCLLRGKKVYIPGAINRTLSLLGKLIPTTAVSSLLYNRWKNAQAKWLDTPAGSPVKT